MNRLIQTAIHGTGTHGSPFWMNGRGEGPRPPCGQRMTAPETTHTSGQEGSGASHDEPTDGADGFDPHATPTETIEVVVSAAVEQAARDRAGPDATDDDVRELALDHIKFNLRLPSEGRPGGSTTVSGP